MFKGIQWILPYGSNSWFYEKMMKAKHFKKCCINRKTCVILGFRHKVHGNCTLLGYYAANNSNFLLTFQDNLSVPS